MTIINTAATTTAAHANITRAVYQRISGLARNLKGKGGHYLPRHYFSSDLGEKMLNHIDMLGGVEYIPSTRKALRLRDSALRGYFPGAKETEGMEPAAIAKACLQAKANSEWDKANSLWHALLMRGLPKQGEAMGVVEIHTTAWNNYNPNNPWGHDDAYYDVIVLKGNTPTSWWCVGIPMPLVQEGVWMAMLAKNLLTFVNRGETPFDQWEEFPEFEIIELFDDLEAESA